MKDELALYNYDRAKAVKKGDFKSVDEIDRLFLIRISEQLEEAAREARIDELKNVHDEVYRNDWDWDNPADFYEAYIEFRLSQLQPNKESEK